MICGYLPFYHPCQLYKDDKNLRDTEITTAKCDKCQNERFLWKVCISIFFFFKDYIKHI